MCNHAPRASAFDLREIRDRRECCIDGGEHAQPVGAQLGILVVDRHLVEESIDRRPELRQKLERDPANPVHFRTVHGVGYKFVR